METPGGAQAIERKIEVGITTESRSATVLMPDLLGALVLKVAAYCTDRRDQHRHLDDAALFASLVTDHAGMLSRMHGSDKKRIRAVAEALRNPRDSSWLLLPGDMRLRGQDTLMILSR